MADDVLKDDAIFVRQKRKPEYLALRFGNRHGPGCRGDRHRKTVTLQVMAEGLRAPACRCSPPTSRAICRVIAAAGEPKISWSSAPAISASSISRTILGGVLGPVRRAGHPIRNTVFEMGRCCCRACSISKTCGGRDNIAFKVADDEFGADDAENKGLIDSKDLRELLNYLSKNQGDRRQIRQRGLATVGSVQRQLLFWKTRAARKFFGEPALDITT